MMSYDVCKAFHETSRAFILDFLPGSLATGGRSSWAVPLGRNWDGKDLHDEHVAWPRLLLVAFSGILSFEHTWCGSGKYCFVPAHQVNSAVVSFRLVHGSSVVTKV